MEVDHFPTMDMQISLTLLIKCAARCTVDFNNSFN